MMGKYFIQAVCLLQCAAQRIQIFLIHILNARCPQVVHPCLILCEGFLVLINRGHYFGGGKNPP